MRRRKANRKRTDVRLSAHSRLAVFFTLVAGVGVVYVWLCSRCDVLGQEIKGLEKSRVEIARRVLNEEYKWLNMKSPPKMEELLRKHGLDMRWPDERQIVRIRMDGAWFEPAVPGWPPHSQYALHPETTRHD
jgi:hypothetical protein